MTFSRLNFQVSTCFSSDCARIPTRPPPSGICPFTVANFTSLMKAVMVLPPIVTRRTLFDPVLVLMFASARQSMTLIHLPSSLRAISAKPLGVIMNM